ncbi:hypothetical protein CY35_05G087400 [Sphagnum magellanicum]|nr:hypothetical protein CY35_05G087400 [Sphagnum magellanicum]KAH9562746.1 hypothetical protein CY35_05G087400 [Sphagnum magellanicum]KAH9562747.1 hypothetical protein CY35_05G087400 [Sphagnum magellanicum]KAH9562749.1 hypothetical protein CY35_05G087400 [Sphagnum magellanicum]
MGWLRSLVCFLSTSRRLTEEEEEEPGNGGAAMAPITRSQCKTSRLADFNTLDAKFSNTTRPFLLRSSKRQRIKEEALKEHDIDHVEESQSATAAADAEPSTVPSPSPSKCKPIISSPGSFEDNCGLCKNSTSKDLFLTSCRHSFCCGCIKEHVHTIIQTQMALTNPTFANLAPCAQCPISSCKEELSRSEVMKLLGHQMLQDYERWLLSAYCELFGSLIIGQGLEKPAPLKLCLSSLCDPRKPTMVLSTSFPDLCPLKVSAEEKTLEGSNEVQFWLCTSCDAAWCAFCGVQLPATTIQQNKLGGKDFPHQMYHADCSGRQKFLLYKFMLELEDARKIYTQGRQVNPDRKIPHKRGRITIWADGTGYGGDYKENRTQTENMQAAAKRKEAEIDSKVANAFEFLTCVLLNSHRGVVEGRDDDGGDYDDATACSSAITTGTYALLGWGNTLQQLLQQLATNDSMLDISERSNLYLKMVALLKAIKTHKELFPILTGCTTASSYKVVTEVVGKHVTTVLQRSSTSTVDNSPDATKGAFVEVNKDYTVMKKMENIYKQARLCLCYESMQEYVTKHGNPMSEMVAPETMVQPPHHDELVEAVTLQSSLKKKKNLEAAAAAAADDEKNIDNKTKPGPTNYKEKLRPLQFKQMSMVDEKAGTYLHHYKDHILGKVSGSSCIDKRGVHNQKRMLHLSKEIASLATTLPLEWESSIHLCVDDQRIDVLRALIIGPNGTPYQNGIFLFDIFLPPDYPQIPPSVHFMTTGGGKVRFNPNLYSSGKICLSLLGTWNGPGWIPGKSTLLQVLVSIQSLIFVQNPYYNEPGFEAKKSPAAEKENMRHREHTLSFAVLAPLRKPDVMFADVISQHFQQKREEVEQQCHQWWAKASDANTKDRMANLMKAIKSQLQILCS